MDFESQKAASEGKSPAHEHHERGRQLIDAIVQQYKYVTASWDDSERPHTYRLVLSKGDFTVTIQFEGKTLSDHTSPEFRGISNGLLHRLRRLFGPGADPH